MKRVAGLVVVIALGASLPANAQTRPVPRGPSGPTDRIFVSVNGGYQLASDEFSDEVTFRENAEDARFGTDYTVESGPAFDVSGGARLWRHLGVGVGVTRYSRATPTSLSGSIPHPFFFNTPRAIAGAVGGLKREERAVHLQARGVFAVSPRLQVMVFGGPSFFQVKQGVVNDVEFAESYPYDAATFSSGVTSTLKESKVGFNAGIDVGFFFTRQLGVGFAAQYAGTTIELALPGGPVDLKAGGLQAGGGLRLRF